MEAAKLEIERVSDSEVVTVLADVTTPDGRKAILKACPPPDILVTNCGGPPTSEFHELTREDWLNALTANMLSALELVQATVYGIAMYNPKAERMRG